jgi:serine/threonine protein kinase
VLVYDLRPVWKKISAEAKDLLYKLLKTDPSQRLSATEAMLHPWITGAAHRAEHLSKLEDAQVNMRARLERRARRAQAAAANAANAQHTAATAQQVQ